jgi:hypothetical integral membrane protein (TIGR02206 family)
MENLSIRNGKPTKFQLGILIFFSIIIVTIIILDLFFLFNFQKPSNIILHNPVPGKKYPPSFTAAGYAWDRESIDNGENINVTIIVTRISDGKIFSFPADRSAVYNEEIPLFELSSFSCPVHLDDVNNAEKWNVSARMVTSAGDLLETTPRRITIDPGVASREFRFFSLQHILALLFICFCVVIIIILFGNNRNKDLLGYAALILSSIILINELAYHIYWYSIGCWLPTNGFLLHMCGVSIVLIPFVLFSWNQKIRIYLGEVVFFWGLGGALQAVLTPDINVHGFPEYKYFSFFISHGFLIITAIFIIIAFNIRIGLWSYIRNFFITNTAVVIFFLANPLFRNIAPFEIANYFVVGYPPPDGSIIDVLVEIFGPSPWYLIGLELVGLAYFGLICIPFLFMKKKKDIS